MHNYTSPSSRLTSDNAVPVQAATLPFADELRWFTFAEADEELDDETDEDDEDEEDEDDEDADDEEADGDEDDEDEDEEDEDDEDDEDELEDGDEDADTPKAGGPPVTRQRKTIEEV